MIISIWPRYGDGNIEDTNHPLQRREHTRLPIHRNNISVPDRRERYQAEAQQFTWTVGRRRGAVLERARVEHMDSTVEGKKQHSKQYGRRLMATFPPPHHRSELPSQRG